ncbi:MAG: DUF488 domain-containing protein [Desulfuromonadaceae bacterium]|nr:DUF488 domain-containing protein [Desulfuromonadaceae bacterium]
MALPFYTIGHSTRTIEEFVELLRPVEVTLVVDIRSIPQSRTNPQYNQETLPKHLAPHEIAYAHCARLGGLRGKSKEISANVNGFWENQSFHNYADYALTQEFRVGLEQLIALGREKRCVVMCAEAVWWRCHRRIVTDYLLARGELVFHLMGNARVEAAHLTPSGQIQAHGLVVYPAEKSKGNGAMK